MRKKFTKQQKEDILFNQIRNILEKRPFDIKTIEQARAERLPAFEIKGCLSSGLAKIAEGIRKEAKTRKSNSAKLSSDAEKIEKYYQNLRCNSLDGYIQAVKDLEEKEMNRLTNYSKK